MPVLILGVLIWSADLSRRVRKAKAEEMAMSYLCRVKIAEQARENLGRHTLANAEDRQCAATTIPWRECTNAMRVAIAINPLELISVL
jgi:hypothetical protein